MSDITIQRAHALSPKKARAAAEAVAADLRAEFGLEYAWDDASTLAFKRAGLSGQLSLGRRRVIVQVHLGLILSPFRATFEREMHDYFDRRFSPQRG